MSNMICLKNGFGDVLVALCYFIFRQISRISDRRLLQIYLWGIIFLAKSRRHKVVCEKSDTVMCDFIFLQISWIGETQIVADLSMEINFSRKVAEAQSFW